MASALAMTGGQCNCSAIIIGDGIVPMEATAAFQT